MSEPVHPALLLFSKKHPMTAELNMRFEVPDENRLHIHVSAPASFADRDGIHVHTGYAALLLDTALGSCAIGKLATPQPIATVKLSLSHLTRPKIGEALVCEAVHDGEENGIAYVNGNIRQISDNRLIANAIGTFMIGTTNQSIREKA